MLTPLSVRAPQQSQEARACKAPFTVASRDFGQPPEALPLQRPRASSRTQEVPASSSSATDLDAEPQGCGGAMRAGCYMACREGGRGVSCYGRRDYIRGGSVASAREGMIHWRNQRLLEIKRPTAEPLR